MRISDWSSDVCSSDLAGRPSRHHDVTAGRLHNDTAYGLTGEFAADGKTPIVVHRVPLMSLKPADLTNPERIPDATLRDALYAATRDLTGKPFEAALKHFRSEEHTSELQSLMRISYAVFCLKKKNTH